MTTPFKPINMGGGSASTPKLNLSLGGSGATKTFQFESDLGATVSGGKISAWADQSGNGRNLVQATSGNQPAYITTNGPNGKPFLRGNGTSARMTSSYTPGTAGTIIALARNTRPNPANSPSGQIDTLVNASDTSFGGLRIETYNDYDDQSLGGNGYRTVGAHGGVTTRRKNGFAIGGLDTSLSLGLNEWAIMTVSWNSMTNLAAMSIFQNATADLFAYNDLAALAGYSTELSVTNSRTEEAYIAWKYGIPHFTTTPKVIICAGDSITRGYALDYDASWPYQMAHTVLKESPSWFIYNEAVDGSTLINVNDRAADASGIDNLTFGGNALNTKPYVYLCLMAGTNDIYVSGDTAATTFTRLLGVVANRKATGKYDRIVIITSIPRGNNTSGWYDYNQLIINNWTDLLAAGATDLIDVTTVTGFTSGTSPTNGTYYIDPVSDLTHPTKVGYTGIGGKIGAFFLTQ